jgi:hypothetical protein
MSVTATDFRACAMLAWMSTDDAIPEPVREGRDLLDDFYGFSEDSDEQYLQGVSTGCVSPDRDPDALKDRGATAFVRFCEVEHSSGPGHLHT